MLLVTPHEFGGYTIDGNVISDHIKDVGVQIDSKLKLHNHTTVVNKKANLLFGKRFNTLTKFIN